jgi:pyruvate/2-oxoacid:ferredoxin oxidoreductase alpha subunit
MKKVLTGNHAVSYGSMLARAEVVAAYPITPQTQIVEKISELCADGVMDAKFIKVESEHSAMAACIGASAAGARAFTATSAQGLALMDEMLHWAAHARLPVVLANINRSMAPPWTIWTDQNDTISRRDTGWIQYYCESNQEVTDSVIQAFKVAEQVELPAMLVLDSFYLSHTSEPVDLADIALVDSYLPKYQAKHDLDPAKGHPAYGALCNDEWYYELQIKMQWAMEKALDVIIAEDALFGEMFGRSYPVVEGYRADDAEYLVFVSSTIASTAKDAVDRARAEGIKAGSAKVRLLRPFPKPQIRKIAKGKKRLGVIDRNISYGSEGAFYTEIKSCLYHEPERPEIHGFIAGLGGRDVTVDAVYEMIKITAGRSPETDINWQGAKLA